MYIAPESKKKSKAECELVESVVQALGSDDTDDFVVDDEPKDLLIIEVKMSEPRITQDKFLVVGPMLQY